MADERHNPELRRMAADLADRLTGVAEEMDRRCANVRIARVTGGIVGLIAVFHLVMTDVGVDAIPFSVGLSIVAAGIGGGIALSAGGHMAKGARIFQLVMEKCGCTELQKLWDKFSRGVMEDMQQNDQDDLDRRRQDLQGVATTEGAAARLEAVTAAEPVALNALLVGFRVVDMVDASLELHRERGSKAGDAMMRMAVCLREYARTGRWAQ